MSLEFFKEKSIFVTGHTGFKGAWLCRMLERAGAFVTGYALAPKAASPFKVITGKNGTNSNIGDIRNYIKSLSYNKYFLKSSEKTYR